MYFTEPIPPETNSRNMYNGPGAASMVAAAQMWAAIHLEMTPLIASFKHVLEEGLLQQWSGPSAIRVVEAAEPFLKWLGVLCKQLFEAYQQALRLYEAYANAHRMVVDPQLVAANRTQLRWLRANNAFGQNATAIAAVQQQYARYWVQDGKAMQLYSFRVLQAISKLTPWKQPRSIANRTGLVQQVPPDIYIEIPESP